jgi:hypothetical protein
MVSAGLSWTQLYTVWFWGLSWPVERLLASQEEVGFFGVLSDRKGLILSALWKTDWGGEQITVKSEDSKHMKGKIKKKDEKRKRITYPVLNWFVIRTPLRDLVSSEIVCVDPEYYILLKFVK